MNFLTYLEYILNDSVRSGPWYYWARGAKTVFSKENGEKMGSCTNTSNDVINLLANDERQTMTYPLRYVVIYKNIAKHT